MDNITTQNGLLLITESGSFLVTEWWNMTNVAISGLPAASTLTGSELVPIVQSGLTSRTTMSAIGKLLLGTYIDARNYAIDPTGATDSSVGGNLAIIDAINQKKALVWPSGLSNLSETASSVIATRNP
jgi:hypothetical protein